MPDVPPDQDTTDLYRPEAAAETTEMQLARALEGYTRELDDGRDPDPQQCLTQYPDLASDLHDCLQGLAAMEELRQALGLPRRASFQPRSLGDYELLEELGRGGMGVVYKARHTKLGRLVALKMIRSSSMAGAAEVQRFRNEAAIVACLDHPAIVPIYEVGEHEGELYFSMKLVEGGKLSDYLEQYQAHPRAAAQLLIDIARAVHHAHQRGIIHRDLKPGNILIEDCGSQSAAAARHSAIGNLQSAMPKITDFGLARRIETDSGLTQEGMVVGTPSYMSPEQAAGRPGAITVASDVYSLGAILYALLTGRAPFTGQDVVETLRLVREQEVAHPSQFNRKVDRDLETICLKCLEKDPQRRYASAEALAQDLELWLQARPIKARKVGRLERLWRWATRHPAATGTVVAVAALMVGAGVKAVLTARERAARLEEEVLRSNVYAAQGMASTILWQLERLSLPVSQLAEEREIRTLLLKKDYQGLQRHLERFHQRHADPKRGYTKPGEESPFKTWYILDAQGIIVALHPPPQEPYILFSDYSRRDYFRGALRHADKTGRAAMHLSRIYKADNMGMFKVALSTVIRDGPGPEAKVIGVAAATITTASTLGTLPLHDERHVAVLVGRHDNMPKKGPIPASLPIEYLVLMHPGYTRGAPAIPFANERLATLHQPEEGSDEFRLPESQRWSKVEEASDPHLIDPLGRHDPRFAGRWLAGFAPVGNTEYVVVVQQRYQDVIELDQRLFRDLLLWAGVAVLVGLVCVVGLFWYSTQRARRLA